MALTPNEQRSLFKSFPINYVVRGRTYFERKRVTVVGRGKDGVLTAVVQGGESYHLTIPPISVVGGKWKVEGQCSCPVQRNCKHVVAALLQADKNGLRLCREEVTTPAVKRRDSNKQSSSQSNKQSNSQSSEKSSNRDGRERVAEDGVDFAEQWLDTLSLLTAKEPEAGQDTGNARRRWGQKRWILYQLTQSGQGLPVKIEVFSGYLKQDGSYSQLQRFNPGNTIDGSPPEAVTPDDERLIRHLYLLMRGDSGVLRTLLQGEDSAQLFEKIVATGRCFWGGIDGEPVTLSQQQMECSLDWQEAPNGEQRLRLRTASEDEITVLPFDSLYYRIAASGEIGPLQSQYPMRLLTRLDLLPPVPPQQADMLQQQLEKMVKRESGEVAIPTPRKVAPPIQHKVAPHPVLRLFMGVVEFEDKGNWYSWRKELLYNPEPVAMADLLFDYDGIRVHYEDAAAPLWMNRDGQRLEIIRQQEEEERYRIEIDPYLYSVREYITPGGRTRIDEQYLRSFCFAGGAEQILEFCLGTLPELRQKGWIIEFAEDWEWQIAEEPDNWYADLDESENDWFSLGLEVDIDGERTSLLPMLVEFISQLPNETTVEDLNQLPDDFKVLVQLEDGRLLPISLEKVRTLLNTLIELYDERPLDENGRIRFNRLEAVRMAELQAAEGAAHLRWMGGERLLDLGRKLRDFKGINSVEPAADFQTELRDYQQTGLSWLQFLRGMELGGILADDMGLGKTVQTLAHLQLEKQSGRMQQPCLVVAPTSLMVNWRSEAEKFVPDLRVTVLHGADRRERFSEISESDIVLTTYPLVTRDHEVLLQQEYYQLILDEAQVIKNPKARVTQLVHQIKAQHRLCLSGTPMENHLGELWSLMHFLNPGLLGDEKQFRRLYRTPIEKRGDSHRQQILQRRVAPFLLRRTKQEVVLELPDKTEIIRSVELEGAQSKLYESIRLSMHKKIKKEVERKGINRSHIIILDALLKLRQVCCDPRLLKLDAAKKVKQSAKLDMLMDLLPEMLEEGRRVLLFSQFTSMLKLIEEALKKRKIDYVKLTGQTKDRATPVERFQAGEVPLFLISLKAGGTGLNLTAADTVIHYDPWWNPAVENQATDRAHRIGQTNSVFVYKFITANTVEEKILELQQRKSALVQGLYGDSKAKAGGALSAEDLQMLFDPLDG